MQSILSLDISANPACLQVVEVDQTRLRVVESRVVELNGIVSRETLCTPQTSATPPVNDPAAPAPAGATPEEPAPQAPPVTVEPPLAALVKSITAPWTNSIVIVPPFDYLSLMLDSPFGDERRLEKIIDLEIQDRVPFDIQEFLVEYRTIGQNANGRYDVHVSIMPRLLVENVLRLCRAADLEPFIITTPASTLEALFHLAPEYFSSDAAVLLARANEVHLLLRFQGKPVADRLIFTQDADCSESSRAALLNEVKLSISEAESRMNSNVERVYLLGDGLRASETQRALGRAVEEVRLPDFVTGGSSDPALATLAAIFAQDSLTPPVLTNARTREFAYSPRLRELLEGLKRLAPYALVALACALIAVTTIYFLRENEISRINDAMQAQIREIMPGADLEPGNEAQKIAALNSKLEEDLGKLGSPSRFPPLEAFREVSSDFQKLSGASIRTLSIRGNRIRIEGSVNGYQDIDALEKALRARKSVYCRIPQPESSRAGANKINFVLTLFTCE